MANYRPMPETSIMHFIAYPADTLYILTENQDIKVSELLDLGKKWRADSVEVIDILPGVNARGLFTLH